MSYERLSQVPEAYSDLPSDLGTATGLGASTTTRSGPPAADSPLALLWAAAGWWLALARRLTLAGCAAGGAATAAAGLALLLFLATTAGLAPPRDTFVRPLALDFSQADLVAQTVFLPEAAAAGYDGLLPADALRDGTRFLAAGQAVDVWVELGVPRGSAQGVAQVLAHLTAPDGRVVAKASRSVLLRSDWWSVGSLAMSPLRWLGLGGEVRALRVPLFRGYREKRDAPFVGATVAIKARNPRWGAEVVSATLCVRLRLGLLRRALYSLRPGPLLLLALGAAGTAMLLGGCTAALLFLGLLLWAHVGGGGATEASEAADEASSSSLSAEAEQLSSASGVSEASSSLLRELEGEGEAPPSPHPAAAAAAAKVERWVDSLPSGSGGGGAGRKPGGGAAPTGPADSAMGGSGAAALRRRVGGIRLTGI